MKGKKKGWYRELAETVSVTFFCCWQNGTIGLPIYFRFAFQVKFFN